MMTIARGLKTSRPVKVRLGELQRIVGGFGNPNPGCSEGTGNLPGRSGTSRRYRPFVHGTGRTGTEERFVHHSLQNRISIENRSRHSVWRFTDGGYNNTGNKVTPGSQLLSKHSGQPIYKITTDQSPKQQRV